MHERRHSSDSASIEASVGALRRLKGPDGESVLGEVIAVYLRDSSEQVLVLAQSLADGDFTLLRRVAHDLGGTSTTLGGETIGRLCRELQVLARKQDLEACRDLAGRVRESHIELLAILEREASTGPPETTDGVG